MSIVLNQEGQRLAAAERAKIAASPIPGIRFIVRVTGGIVGTIGSELWLCPDDGSAPRLIGEVSP